MLNQSDIDKMNRFSKGLSDAEETQYIYSLFSENEEKGEFKQHIQKEFNEYLKNHPDENHHLSYLLDRIHHTIHKSENQKKQTIIKRIYRGYSVAAAVLLIPILIAGAIWFAGYDGQDDIVLAENPSISTLHAPKGSRVSFSLPDGTKGWLNSGSSLEYQLPFSSNRQITVSGEAWFDVFHDADHPFEITVGNSKVEVLGTTFNINAYPEENYIEVVLEEGKVEFSTPRLLSNIEMKPNERLVFSKNHVKIHNTLDASRFAAWKEGKLVFRGDPMSEVARRLERWYNVTVVVGDKELEKYVFRGTFQDDTLEEVLRYLSMTSPMDYRIVERKLLDNGIIQKRKVLLYKRSIIAI